MKILPIAVTFAVGFLVIAAYFKRFCDWVPIIEREKHKRLLQTYPVNIWFGHVSKKTALKLFDEGTQAQSV